MEHTSELDHALKNLRQVTGISLDVKTDTPEEAAQALAQIRCLYAAYQEKYNKTHF